VFDQLLGANFVRDAQVPLRKAALDDRLEAFQIRRHAHCSGFRPGHGDGDDGCADAEFAPRHSHCPVVSDSGRPCGKVSESACIF
jgi:hypothetical protein